MADYELRRLTSGYLHARASRELWAQWQAGETPIREDVFNPEWGAEPFFEWWERAGRQQAATLGDDDD